MIVLEVLGLIFASYGAFTGQWALAATGWGMACYAHLSRTEKKS